MAWDSEYQLPTLATLQQQGYAVSGSLATMDPYVLESGYGVNAYTSTDTSPCPAWLPPSLCPVVNAPSTGPVISPQPTTQSPGACTWWQAALFMCKAGTDWPAVPDAGPGGLNPASVFPASGFPNLSVDGANPSGATHGGAFAVGGMDASSTGGASAPGETNADMVTQFEDWFSNAGIYLILGIVLVIVGVWVLTK